MDILSDAQLLKTMVMIITQEIIDNVHEKWHSKSLLIASDLNLKHAILYEIGMANWISSSYGSSITLSHVVFCNK